MGLSGCAKALRIAVVSGLALLFVLPGSAFAASTAEIATDASGPFVRVNGDAADDDIRVTLAGGNYTVSDTTGGVTAGSGCTQAGADVTCPATGITWTEINGGEGGDTLFGSDGRDRINGGPGPDNLDGARGDDLFNTGQGGIDFATCADVPPFRCADDIGQGVEPSTVGFDTVTYADRTAPVEVNLGTTMPTANVAKDADGTFDGLNGIEGVVGGLASDEIIGGLFGETLNGGPGNAPDLICGGLGKDTVDYSDKTAPVSVSLDGSLPTDPDIVSGDPLHAISARRDCRPTIKDFNGPRNGQVCTPINTHPSCPADLHRDCVENDGVAGEHDCVGEDVERIVGSPQDDILIGNNPDALYGLGPRAEPSGENVINGGGGNDLMDGGLGPDTYIGGAGLDAVSYEGRNDDIAASLDGAANDGSALDRYAPSGMTDEITGDVEDLIGGSGNDLLKGDGSGNVLLGGPGDDLIQGHGGEDNLGGDAGNDTLEGGEAGDRMEGGPDNDLLFGGFGNDAYDGGDGTDTADFSDSTTPVSVTINGAADDGRASEGDNVGGTIESLIGGIDDDNLNANDGDGTLKGGGGNDTLNGGLGADVLIGGTGVDTAAYGGHPGPVNVNLAIPGDDGMADEGDDVTADVEGIGGSSFDDVLSGDGKLNTINGGAGNDRISGAEGDDFLAGGLGNDTINGDVGDDILDGAEGDDTLNGTAGNDTLKGFTGADVLDGGTGADTMSGGGGVDVVSYASRSADVSVDLLGTPDDGEKGENDQVRTDVESARTGSGDDKIDIVDGAAGAATCGGGTDVVKADADDEIGAGCEAGGVTQSSVCKPATKTAKVSKSGTVSVPMKCGFNARGTLQLKSAGKLKTGKGKARKLSLGKKSFTGKAGKSVMVKVKISKSARKALKGKKLLKAEALLSVRRDGTSSAMRTNKTKLTLRVSRK